MVGEVVLPLDPLETFVPRDRRLLKAGMTVKHVQTWAGHASAMVTQNVYAWVLDGDLPKSPFGRNSVGTVSADTSRQDDEAVDAETRVLRAVSP